MRQLKRLIRKFIGNTPNAQGSEPLILNEAVNFGKRCIFIAVPKTGTTSVRNQLRQQGAPLIANPHLNIMQVRDSLYVYFLKRALGNNKTFPTEPIPGDADLRAQANEVFNTYFKFSAVRNPWARAISLYFRREGVQLKDKISFDEFCEDHLYASDTCCQPTVHKNQIDWLCNENGQCVMDYVYKLENFAEAIKDIEELTDGRLKITNKNENNNPKSPSREYRMLYTENTKKIIAKRFEKDIDYFEYTF